MLYHIELLVVLVTVLFEKLSDVEDDDDDDNDGDKRCTACYSNTDQQFNTLRWNSEIMRGTVIDHRYYL